MVILWDGKVVPCCEDFDRKMVLGNVEVSSIEEIWNSNAMVNLRNKHVRGEFHSISLCRGCSEYEGYPHNPLWPIDPNLFKRFSLLSKLFFTGKIAPSIFRG